MKNKILVFFLLVVFLVSTSSGFSFLNESEYPEKDQDQEQNENKGKFELSFHFGIGFLYGETSSTFSHIGGYMIGGRFEEKNFISTSPKMRLSVGGDISYFPTNKIGIQVAFGYFKAKVPNESLYDFSWGYGTILDYSSSAAWSGDGEIRVLPVSLNCITKFRNQDLRLNVSGGLALFFNKFHTDSFVGMVVSRTVYYYDKQKYWFFYDDALKVPGKIKESWRSLGLNLGAEVELRIAKKADITIDARYYYCPSKELMWKISAGSYTGFVNNLDWTVQDYTKQFYEGGLSPFTVNPSFLMVSVGLKFSLSSH